MAKKDVGAELVALLLGPSIEGDVVNVAYSRKGQFKRIGKKYMTLLAEAMGLKKGEYDVRFNPGGPAVSGDLSLHTDHLYVLVSQGMLSEPSFMYRSCRSRKDTTGGANQWLPIDKLRDIGALATVLEVEKRVATIKAGKNA